jgi:hypothetical protein
MECHHLLCESLRGRMFRMSCVRTCLDRWRFEQPELIRVGSVLHLSLLLCLIHMHRGTYCYVCVSAQERAYPARLLHRSGKSVA